MSECRDELDSERLERLLGRGFLLAQAVERWRTRAIWVLSRADADYPRRLKQRLGGDAPPILYGCGEAAILGTGGLAVVGSRNVHEALIEYTENVGRLAASAGRGLVSGGARGVDRAAMRGALDAGGRVAGVLADGLEKAAIAPGTSGSADGRAAGSDFSIRSRGPFPGRTCDATQQADLRALGRGAGRQLGLRERRHLDRGDRAARQAEARTGLRSRQRHDGEGSRGASGTGGDAMAGSGDLGGIGRILDAAAGEEYGAPGQQALSTNVRDGPEAFEKAPDTASSEEYGAPAQRASSTDIRKNRRRRRTIGRRRRQGPPSLALRGLHPADELFAKVRELIERMDGPRPETDVAEDLQVSKQQAEIWLVRFAEGKIRSYSRARTCARPRPRSPRRFGFPGSRSGFA